MFMLLDACERLFSSGTVWYVSTMKLINRVTPVILYANIVSLSEIQNMKDVGEHRYSSKYDTTTKINE